MKMPNQAKNDIESYFCNNFDKGYFTTCPKKEGFNLAEVIKGIISTLSNSQLMNQVPSNSRISDPLIETF